MILDNITADTRIRVEQRKKETPAALLQERAEGLAGQNAFPFREMLKQRELQFICEVKKASPSKGLIAADFPYVEIAKDYEEAGAGAISVLTEPHYFQGDDGYLQEIRQAVKLPLLRKDFVVDAYQIYEAKCLGADAILLIAAILTDTELEAFLALAKSLGLSALVEVHDKEELTRALGAGANIIGVNNRNLKDFTVRVENTLELAPLVPDPIPLVAESGLKTPEDIQRLREAGVRACLIGETLMRATDKRQMLAKLRGEAL